MTIDACIAISYSHIYDTNILTTCWFRPSCQDAKDAAVKSKKLKTTQKDAAAKKKKTTKMKDAAAAKVRQSNIIDVLCTQIISHMHMWDTHTFLLFAFTSCQAIKEAADEEALAKKSKASAAKKKKAKKDADAKVRWYNIFDVFFTHMISHRWQY